MHEYQTMGHILIVAVNPFHAWKIRRQRKNEKNAAPVNLIMGFLFYEYAVIVIAWLALQYGISCNVMGIRIDLSIYLYRNVLVVSFPSPKDQTISISLIKSYLSI